MGQEGDDVMLNSVVRETTEKGTFDAGPERREGP